MAASKIKVLVIDDSAVMRQILTAILQADPMLEVVGSAADPYIAREKIKKLSPDVLTLDVEMPGMDGITFLEKLMRLHPLPVVMVSSLTKNGANTTLKALELGAIDFVTKPNNVTTDKMNEITDEICEKVRTASIAKLKPFELISKKQLNSVDKVDSHYIPRSDTIVAIGASAGGTQALQVILESLPKTSPGVVIVQHMPEKFTSLFAKRLNQQCAIEVREAQDGDIAEPGLALIAPGNFHMAVDSARNQYSLRVFTDDPVNRHRPAVDVLFNSIARYAGANALGIILTGMGDDGADGINQMRKAGAHTIAQDKQSCVVFGMPDQAIRRGGIIEILDIGSIASSIMEWAVSKNKK